MTTAITEGDAITISADNVTLDCNDFRIDGLAAGPTTGAVGIYAQNGSNERVRHCNIRGFSIGLYFNVAAETKGGRSVVEDNHFDQNIEYGVEVEGDQNVVRRNEILHTGNAGVQAASVGIQTNNTGSDDIIDNTILGVSGECGSALCGTGIVVGTESNEGTNVIGNRIGGLPPDTSGAVGILIDDDAGAQVAVRDNELIGSGGTGTGVSCPDTGGEPEVRVHDNVIAGFATARFQCTDAGENDTSP